MGRNLWTVAAISAALVLGVGAGAVMASHGVQGSPSGTAKIPLVTSGGSPCAMATVAARGDTFLYSNATKKVVSVTLRKGCAGPVTALLSAETSGPIGTGVTDRVKVGAKITCIATGGFTNPCRRGATVWAIPAGNPALKYHDACLSCPANGDEATAINLSWPILPSGVYRIKVVGTASGTSDAITDRTLQAIGWSKG